MVRTRWSVAPIVLCLWLGACASSGGAAADGTPSTRRGGGNEILLAELQDPGVSGLNAYEAIRRLRPNWLRERGATSIRGAGDNLPRVMLNESSQSIDALSGIQAREITSLVYISGSDATTRFGTGYPNGAILVSTLRSK